MVEYKNKYVFLYFQIKFCSNQQTFCLIFHTNFVRFKATTVIRNLVRVRNISRIKIRDNMKFNVIN